MKFKAELIGFWILAVLIAQFASAQAPPPEAIPENVAAWFDAAAKEKSRAEKQAADSVDAAQKKGRAAKTPAERKKAQNDFKSARDAMDKIQKQDVTEFIVEMPIKPEVGQVGFVNSVRVVKVLGETSAIVEMTSVSQNWVARGNTVVPGDTTTRKGKLIVSGVDTAKWPEDSPVNLDRHFEAASVDQTKRLIVLKPFDAEAWKGKYTAPKPERK